MCQAIADSFLPLWGATALAGAVMVTAGVGIPLRCYLMSAVGFDYQRLGEKFRQMFPFVLALDQLWAVAPFLLIQEDRSGRGLRGQRGAALSAVFGANSDSHGVCRRHALSSDKIFHGTNLTDRP